MNGINKQGLYKTKISGRAEALVCVCMRVKEAFKLSEICMLKGLGVKSNIWWW